MKKTLAFDRNARQFRADIAGKRLYLGVDADAARQRKRQIVQLFSKTGEWTPKVTALAHSIRKGQPITVFIEPMESEPEYLVRRDQLKGMVPSDVAVGGAITSGDVRNAIIKLLRERVAELEAELKEIAGPRVAERSTILLAEVLDEWIAYRKTTNVKPGTTTPTDSVRGEMTMINFIRRQLPEGLKLASLDYAQIDLLCKKIAARPLSQIGDGRQPIGRDWAKEALKTIRRVIRWASRTYGYRKPEEWLEATRGQQSVGIKQTSFVA